MAQSNTQRPSGTGKIANNIRRLLDASQRQNQMRSYNVMTNQTSRGTTRSTQFRRPVAQVRQSPVAPINLVARWS